MQIPGPAGRHAHTAKSLRGLQGFFLRKLQSEKFQALTGETYDFVQDNHSKSEYGVIRGLHYQLGRPQGKIIRVVEGAIFDVVVDIRSGSPTFGRSIGVTLTAEDRRQLWVPPDFAHGFAVISEKAQVCYKTTSYYAPECERSIRWDDPELNISWPNMNCSPILSDKDRQASYLRDAEVPLYAL